MRRVALLGLLLTAALVAGCGEPEPKPLVKSVPHKGFICERKVPAQMHECIAQEEVYKGTLVKPSAPPTVPPPTGVIGGVRAVKAGASYRPQCADVSVWQGLPNLRVARANGMRCLIIQTNDGGARNSLFYRQAALARDAGMPFGCYTFVEAMSTSYQADILGQMCSHVGATLGGWADTEVSGSYEHACPFVYYLRSVWHYRIAGVYASGGNYFGGACGYGWAAEWGSNQFYPLPGFSYAATKFRQWCGTCRFPGFSGEVDRDEDLGLLALAGVQTVHQPTKAELRKQLYRLYSQRGYLRHQINVLRVLVRAHQCAYGDHRHATPVGYRHRCNIWLQHGTEAHARGDVVNRQLADLHRKGV